MTHRKASTARRRHAAPGPTRYTDPAGPTLRSRAAAALKRFLGVKSPTAASARPMSEVCPITVACDRIERASEARLDALKVGTVRITKVDDNGNPVAAPYTVTARITGYDFDVFRGTQC